MATPLHNELDLDAYWMPFTANRAFKSAPRLIQSASGMMCRTDDGRDLLDSISGLWCCNAGHCHPRIAAAIAEQAATLDYTTAFQVGHPTVFRLAERIAAMAPGDLDAVFFTNSGSESVDTALKIALAYHQARGDASRTRLIGRERGYHGVGFGGMSVGGIGNNRKSFGPLLPGVLHLPTTYDYRHQAFSRGQPEWGAHLADELERIVAVNHPSTIAAVIVEPFAGSAGVLVPPVGYLERLREITAHYGILLIFDEVITAFGRLGASFAATRFEVVPDLITCAKGITSGTVPMGAVLARESIRSTIIENAPGRHRAVPWLHLLRPSLGIGCRDGDPRCLRGRATVRTCAPPSRRCSRTPCMRWPTNRTSRTSATSAWRARWNSSRARANPARAPVPPSPMPTNAGC